MTDYYRVGNRTLTATELGIMTPKQVEEIKIDAERANQKRLENTRRGLGMEPQKITLNVTPEAVAARNEAIVAEEVKIEAETKAIAKELGPETPAFVAEDEAPAEAETKKTRGNKKAV